MVFGPERDVSLGPLHSSIWLDVLSRAYLSFKLLALRLRGDGQSVPEDHVDFIHLVLIVGISPMMFSSTRLLRRWLHRHLFVI
jgi:hypothetical protein